MFRRKKGKILILYVVVATIGLASLLRLMSIGYEIEILKSIGLNLNGGQVTFLRALNHYHNFISKVPAMESIERKRNILLFVGIFSAPVRNDRRNAIRENEYKRCLLVSYRWTRCTRSAFES